MPLGTEVGLGPSDIVLDGDPAPPTQRGTVVFPNFFRPMSIVAKRLHGSGCLVEGPMQIGLDALLGEPIFRAYATLTLTLRTKVLHL